MKKQFRKYKRSEKTDYAKRLSLLKSGVPRLVVRITQKNLYAQLVEYAPKGDKMLFSYSSASLIKVGWKGTGNSIPAAYLVGYSLGKKASSKVKEAIVDIGKRRSVEHSRIYAIVKGAIDAGLKINAEEKVFPTADRIEGKHISSYAEKLKQDKEKYEKTFSAYLKKGLSPDKLSDHFQDIKSKI